MAQIIGVPDNFNVEFPEEYDSFWLGVNSAESCLKTFIKNQPYIINQVSIDIWLPNNNNILVNDYWFRMSVYNNYILITDYSGFKIYNFKLDLIFKYDIPNEDKYIDVFGYEFSNNTLSLWSMNTAQDMAPVNVKIDYQSKDHVSDDIIQIFNFNFF